MKHNGSMLDPSMGDLKARINNRYLLVNVTARLAREISQKAEDEEISLDNKPVTIALHEIADGEVAVVKTEEGETNESTEEMGELKAENAVHEEDKEQQ